NLRPFSQNQCRTGVLFGLAITRRIKREGQAVRVVSLKDDEQTSRVISEFVRQVSHEFEPPLTTFIEPDLYAKKVLREGVALAVLADDSEQMEGLVVFYCNPSAFTNAWISLIASLRRGAGVGSTLMRAAISSCREAGMR